MHIKLFDKNLRAFGSRGNTKSIIIEKNNIPHVNTHMEKSTFSAYVLKKY